MGRESHKSVARIAGEGAAHAFADGWITRILVLALTLLAALDKFGFQIAPLVAAVGVAGVGVGFAFQGVLGNIVAGLSIIFTKPYRVGEYIELLNVHGQVVTNRAVLDNPGSARSIPGGDSQPQNRRRDSP
jgi:hypothetical protein